jgi:plastocyanin
MSRARTARFIGYGVALLVLVAGPRSSNASPASVEIQDNHFVAAAITVNAGDTVTWTETGVGTHSVTADDGTFDSSPNCPTSCLSHGSTFTHTFTTPGTYRYYCRIHGGPNGVGMSGIVTVVGPPTPTSLPTGTVTSAPLGSPPAGNSEQGSTSTGVTPSRADATATTNVSANPLAGTPDVAG